MPPPAPPCVVIVPSAAVFDPSFEEALSELRYRGHPVWRVRDPAAAAGVRDRMLDDALAAGYAEVLLADPAVVFQPADVDRFREHASTPSLLRCRVISAILTCGQSAALQEVACRRSTG